MRLFCPFRPAIGIIGEEGTKQRDCTPPTTPPDLTRVTESLPSYSLDSLTLYIDPLDGTRDYVHGDIHNVTVLIGIVHEHRPIAGIIHFPFVKDPATNKDRVIWGAVGSTVHGIQSHPFPSDGRTYIAISGSFATLDYERYLYALKVFFSGSFFHSQLLVAC